MIEIFKYQYFYFYRKVFKKKVDFSDKDIKKISTFLTLLKKEYKDSIGEEWLFDYLTFQFNKFANADTKMSLQIGWIYGKKGLQYWKERNLEHHKFFDEKFKKEYNIKRGDVIKSTTHPGLSKQYKSRERNRFKNYNRKFLHCSELELFDEKSADCIFCKNKKICRNDI